MYNCPLLFIANKSLLKKESNLEKVLYNSPCLKQECLWFDSKNHSCIIRKNPDKSYIQKTLGCI